VGMNAKLRWVKGSLAVKKKKIRKSTIESIPIALIAPHSHPSSRNSLPSIPSIVLLYHHYQVVIPTEVRLQLHLQHIHQSTIIPNARSFAPERDGSLPSCLLISFCPFVLERYKIAYCYRQWLSQSNNHKVAPQHSRLATTSTASKAGSGRK